MLSRKNLTACLYLAALAWLNIYPIREMFNREATGHMNSMHGVWLALAGIPAGQWTRPTWWPLWAGGMPFEYTYAPLVPALTAAGAALTGATVSHAYHFLAAGVYVLVPLTLFLMTWRLGGSAGTAFAAGLVYSLLAPGEMLLPGDTFHWHNFRHAWRMSLAVGWDEVPHLAALAMLPLFVWFLHRALTGWKARYHLAAGAAMAVAMLGSAFGATMTALAAGCLLFVLGRKNWRARTARTAAIAAAAYLVVSPFYPPPLLWLIRSNGARYDPWTITTLIALAALALAWSLAWWATRGLADWFPRFVIFFTLVTGAIPALSRLTGAALLFQPMRYKIEFEMGLALLLALAMAYAARRLSTVAPRPVLVALVLFLASLAAGQLVSLRKVAKTFIWGTDITSKLEYRLSRWVERNLPGQRVMLPGSLGQWANAFTVQPQLGGGSYTTAPNWNQQLALAAVYGAETPRERETAVSLLWLKAFGVGAVATVDAASEEFWKPFPNPAKFEGVLPVLWREPGTTLHRVPQRSTSLAYVVNAHALVARAPRNELDTSELERYVAALDDAAMPVAEMRWQGFNHIRIRAAIQAGQAVSVQVNHHPGWRARINGTPAPIGADRLGFMVLRPPAPGPAEIELDYSGGWEYWLCRAASLLTLAGAAFYGLRRRTRA